MTDEETTKRQAAIVADQQALAQLYEAERAWADATTLWQQGAGPDLNPLMQKLVQAQKTRAGTRALAGKYQAAKTRRLPVRAP